MIFKDYANYYDSFYPDSKYQNESLNLFNVIRALTTSEFRFHKALEIGCGTGRFSQHISNYVHNLIAIDISEKMIEIASRKPNKKITFLNKNLEEMSSTGKYDAIFSLFHVISYFNENEMDSFVNFCKENVAKNGYVIFDYWEKSAVLKNPPINSEKIAVFNNQIIRIQDDVTDDEHQSIGNRSHHRR